MTDKAVKMKIIEKMEFLAIDYSNFIAKFHDFLFSKYEAKQEQ